MKRIFCLISALLLSFPLLLQAGPFMSSGGGVALQDSDGSSGGSAHTLKLSTGDWSVTGGVATLPSDNETLINRLIDTWGDAADIDGGTIDGTVIGGPTPIWYAWWTDNETTETEGKWYCFNGVEVTEP